MPKKETTLEELAIMIAKGFEHTASKEDFKHLDNRMDKLEGRMDGLDGRMDGLGGRMDHIETELSTVNARLSSLEHKIDTISSELISRNEFEDLMGRVKYLEIKLGIESGK